ncbi:MAG: hypothetical protein R6X29_07265 [Acidimicrobiia bacterium]|jgi:hypothetical protein
MAGDEHRGEPEVYESIPWQDLVDLRSDRRRWVYPAVAFTLLGVLVFGVARTFRPTPEVLTVPATSPGSVPAATAPVVPAPVTSIPDGGSAVEAAVAPSPSLYTEADLMAAGEAVLSATAGALAEWFVVGWFTVDGAEPPDWIAAIAGAPHGGSGRSYVEWARTTVVESLAPGLFRVEVAVRRLAASDSSSGYRRVPDGAVEVVVDLTGETPWVIDVPRPVPAAIGGPDVEWGAPVPDPPEAVVTAARQAAGANADAAVTVWSNGTGWRAVVGVADAAGVVWPAAVWLDASAGVVPPGSGR